LEYSEKLGREGGPTRPREKWAGAGMTQWKKKRIKGCQELPRAKRRKIGRETALLLGERTGLIKKLRIAADVEGGGEVHLRPTEKNLTCATLERKGKSWFEKTWGGAKGVQEKRDAVG